MYDIDAAGAAGARKRHFEGAAVRKAVYADEQRDGKERYVARGIPQKGETDAEHRRRERDEEGEQHQAGARHVPLAVEPREEPAAAVARLLEGAEHAEGAKAVQERGGRADDEIFENGRQCEHI